ncbi:hypothetical protein [Cytobacillus firmus]|uniref:hypothetical protein n=1 Tax=Cytobacillus firmus TaxID=1399 RepID=UPI0030015EA4
MKSTLENEILLKFGVPEIEGIKKENLNLKFEGEDCYKFSLFNKEERIFSMDFYIRSGRIQNLYNRNQPDDRKYLKLQLLHVLNDNIRKKGISTYYLNRLVTYAKEQGFTHIKVLVNPDDEAFKEDKKDNALNLEQLKSFYKKFEDKEIKIEF